MATSFDVRQAEFSVDVHPAPGACIVTVTGEIDLLTAPEIETALTQASRFGMPVVLDLCAVPFCDSSGLRVLIEARDRIVLACVPDGPVRRVIAISGADGLLPAHATCEAALRAVA